MNRMLQIFSVQTESLSQAVNVLTNSLKVLHITKSDFFKLNFFESDQ